MKIERSRIIAVMNTIPGRAVTVRELSTLLGLPRTGRDQLRHTLDRMVRGGELLRDERNRYIIASATRSGRDEGVIFPHPDGYGFVRIDGKEDLFVPARFVKDALPGDRVEVERVTGRFGRREGRVVRIVERSPMRIVGRYESGRKGWGRVLPDDPRIRPLVLVRPGENGGARDGELVSVVPVEGGRPGEIHGRVVRVIGPSTAPDVEIISIVERYGIPDRFSDGALLEASRAPGAVRDEDLTGRKDLRDLPFVTIDGETARDFDDAVAILPCGDGYRLLVAIADVSHYVPEGSAIDRDAYERGTSVYFPDRCIPMLPEELSNGICSLNPHVDRLVMVADMEFDRSGAMGHSHFYPAVIRSLRRLTYSQVARLLEERDPSTAADLAPLSTQLELMGELASLLTQVRRRRGSIDFDLPEAEIVIGLTGSIEDVVRRERNAAHRLIEEFMLSANEAVARFVTSRGAPFLYRIHEPPSPEKLEAVREMFASLGVALPTDAGEVTPGRLRDILQEVAGAPHERLVNELLLRSMKQARYSPENQGHFGLASPFYTHFTSPIRRYPDLVVHRILKSLLGVEGAHQPRRPLEETGSWTSMRERVAMEAEREVVQLMKIRFMADRIGDSFSGVISSVSPYGCFVELNDFFVEGMVHVSLLPPDTYRFDDRLHALVGMRSRLTLRIGDPVTVRLVAASSDNRRIDFIMEEHHGGALPLPSPTTTPPHRREKGRGGSIKPPSPRGGPKKKRR